MRHLSGPSAANEVSEKLRKGNENEKCWRRAGDAMSVCQATVRSLRSGLKKARQEVAQCRRSYLGNVSSGAMASLDRKIQAYSSKERREVRNDLSAKTEKIKKENENCASHQLCQWMRKRLENKKQQDTEREKKV